MIEQVQCDNCRGFKVDTTFVRIDPETGKEVHSMDFGDGCALGFGIAIAMVVLSACVIGGLFNAHPSPGPETIIETLLLLSFPVLPVLLPIVVSTRINRRYNRATTLEKCYCTLCGKRWVQPVKIQS